MNILAVTQLFMNTSAVPQLFKDILSAVTQLFRDKLLTQLFMNWTAVTQLFNDTPAVTQL